MKWYLLGSVFLMGTFSAHGMCIKKSIPEYINSKELIQIKQNRHTLVYSKDSCGVTGCEIFVFTELLGGCKILTLNTKAHVPSKPLNGNSLKLRQNKMSVTYQYSRLFSKFRKLR